MSITYVASGDAVTNYANGSSILDVNLPPSAQPGDAIILVTHETGHGTVTRPDGFQSLSLSSLATVYTRTIRPGETTYRWARASGSKSFLGGVWIIYRGAHPTLPIQIMGVAEGSYTAPSVTSIRNNCVLLCYSQAGGAYGTVFTPPVGMTERADQIYGGTAISHTLADVDLPTAGATGAKAFTAVNPGLDAPLVSLSIVVEPPPPPTVVEVIPPYGPPVGGTTVAISGTGFTESTAVTIGGNPCTGIVVESASLLRCVVPAGTAGLKDVVVTNAAGSGTLEDGFRYVQVRDLVVKLVKGGSVVGDNKGATSTDWPGNPGVAAYGGASDLWGTTWTPAEVNAADFGMVLQAAVGTDAVAEVDHVRMRVHYSVPGLQDPATYVAVLRVDADRATARPDLYKLPRAGLTVGNDAQIDRALAAGGEFRLSRIDRPGRTVEKVWHSWECYLNASVEENTPGLQWWARVDDGPRFQLLDAAGAPATLRRNGAHEVFFPKSDVSRGKYVQLIAVVPAVVGDQVAAAYDVSEMALQMAVRPKMTEVFTVPLILRDGEFEDKTSMRRTAAAQLQELKNLVRPGLPAVRLRSPEGEEMWAHVVGLSWTEQTFKGENRASSYVAQVTIRAARYE